MKPRHAICLLIAIASTCFAADPPKPVTTDDPKVATADLELLLKPLTKAQVTVEADGWQALLQEKVAEQSKTEIQAAKAQGDDKSKLIESVSKLREERTALIDRLNVVLAELKTKGGAPADYETYINAVSGVKVQINDASGAWLTILSWLKSPEGGIRYGKNIVLFIATLIVFRILAGMTAGITNRTMGAVKNVSHLLRDFVVNAVRKIVFFVGFVLALSMLEVNIGPFLAAMGAVGFVIGFALQGTLSNFASGVMILLYRPYDLHDKVTVAGNTGQVTAMTLVSTVMRNADGHTVVIPNSAIWGGTITNLGPGEKPVAAAR